MIKISEEIFYPEKSLVIVSREHINLLKSQALKNRRKCCRLCTHPDTNDSVHEMLIAHVKGNYVRPHKHINKPESFHVIEGELTVLLFDEDGVVTESIEMGSFASGRAFYYRISDNQYHTLVVKSDIVVFHETTKGPFDRSDTVFAPWASDEKDYGAIKSYMEKLTTQCQR